MGFPRMPIAQRLANLSIPEPNSGCTLWLGTVIKSGYGHVKWGGETLRAHRVSWELKNGPIPDGMMVLHKCDVPICINPDHLFLGTADDNSKDMIRKRRSSTGVKHGSRTHPESRNRGTEVWSARLTDDDVRAIRQSNESAAALARKYKFDLSQICKIRKGKAWTHVKMERPNE